MLTLYLVRHAKSSWDDSSLKDFDRPLNERGRRDAPFMARVFQERGEPVDMIVTSPAVRALSTARIFAHQLNLPHEHLHQEREIYEAGPDELMRVVRGLPDGARRVMLFGHDPGLTMFADDLAGGVAEIPTCGIVRIDFALEHWVEVGNDAGTLVRIEVPKQHPELR